MSLEILNVSVHATKPNEKNLPAFDNTKLVALNTCPLWGIVRYTLHKTTKGTGRAMSLEAGRAAHEVFAAHRLFSFKEFGAEFYPELSDEDIDTIARDTGHRIFGRDNYDKMVRAVDPSADYRSRNINFSLEALYNSGFYDDPRDRGRTMTNIEEMCIAYMHKFTWKDNLPVVFNKDGERYLGIEIPVDVVVTVEYKQDGETRTLQSRLIGKADGVHYANKERAIIRVHENKTAARLGDAWSLSWETNHQPTGYMIALASMFEVEILEAEMLGTALPMPRNYSLDGLARVTVKRKQWQLLEWFRWFTHTVLIHDEHVDNPLEAPQYTHSCNRYFRPCSLIYLCASEPEEKQMALDEMAVDEWSPLHGLDGTLTDE